MGREMVRSRRSRNFLVGTLIAIGATCVGVVGFTVIRTISDALDPKILNQQTVSGVMRLTNDSFGLLVYPCGDNEIDVVELGVLVLNTRQFIPILRVTFESPVKPRSVIISTDPDFVTPGVKREVLNADLLDRVNTDETYLVESDTRPVVIPDSVLDIVAHAPDDALDRAGSAGVALGSRFTLNIDEATVYRAVPAAIDQFTCLSPRHRAWDAVTV